MNGKRVVDGKDYVGRRGLEGWERRAVNEGRIASVWHMI